MAGLILGSSGADPLLAGTAGPDAILGFDQNATAAGSQLAAIEASRVAAGLVNPVFVTAPPLDPDHLFVVERGGRVLVLDLASGAIAPEPFLDLSGQVATAGEQGLLGLAFHPDFSSNGRFYVHLSNPEGDSEIREYVAPAGDPARADPGSARLVLRVDQPEGLSNHKGGWIGFGPDGQLHVALGDGGGGGDPFGNGQNPATLLGAILRLDPGRDEFPADPARNYGIPADNPFAAGGGTGAAPEVWAHGLRNPWRDSFDRATGELWIGDVGQGRWEEIDLGAAGANFGWNRFEGPEPFTPGASPEGLTGPVFAYGRDLGAAVTGGHVYRGPEDALQGAYFFADFVSGRVWSLARAAAPGAPPAAVTERTGQLVFDAGALNSPVSFGEDAEGRLYVVDFDGEVFRLTPRGMAGAPGDGADLLEGGGGDDGLFAGAGADRLLGADGADTLFGMGDADMLEGGSGPDLLWGGEGDDLLLGGPGADWIHGGGGAGDTAVFSGLRGDYDIPTAAGGVLTVSDRRPGGDGADLFSAVETFAFADGVVARDVLLAGGGDGLLGTAF
jgi:glucose/arabinose dehydrogenase